MNWKELSDQRLVELCLEGNNDAWVEFLRRHRPLIFSAIISVVGIRQAHTQCPLEDLRSEVHQKVYSNNCKALHELKWEHEGSLTGLVWTIAQNVARDWKRRARAGKRDIDKEVSRDDPDFVEPAPPMDPNTARNNKIYVEELLKCLKGVIQDEPDWQRDIHIFRFYYGYGFTAKDLARIYKMDIRKVENTAARLARLIRSHCL